MDTKIKLLITISIILASTNLSQITTTPSPAPSKTPPSDNIQPETTASTSSALEIKNQDDLNILTGNIQRPNGLAWHNGKLYTACTGDWTLYEIDTTTGTTHQYIYGVRNAHTIYPTSENEETHLWVPDFQTNSLVHIHQGISEVITSELSGPWGITNLDQDTFLVTNLSGNNLVSINRNGEVQEVISKLRSPTGITSDEEHIYIANTGSTRRAIEWFTKAEILDRTDPIPSDTDEEHSLLSGLQNTTNLTIGPDQLLYFSYALGTRGIVGRIDPQVCREKGGCTSDEVEIVLYTELTAPLAGLTFSPDMKLYIHSIFSPDIYWVQLEQEENT